MNRAKAAFCLLVIAFLVTTSVALAADRLVPGQYATIQAAVDAAVSFE